MTELLTIDEQTFAIHEQRINSEFDGDVAGFNQWLAEGFKPEKHRASFGEWKQYGYEPPEIPTDDPFYNDRPIGAIGVAEYRQIAQDYADEIIANLTNSPGSTRAENPIYLITGGEMGLSSSDKFETFLPGLKQQISENNNASTLVIDFEPYRRELIKRIGGTERFENGDTENGRILNPMDREYVRFLLNTMISAVAANALRLGHNVIFRWPAHGSGADHINALPQNTIPVLVATDKNIFTAIDEAYQHGKNTGEITTPGAVSVSCGGFIATHGQTINAAHQALIFDVNGPKPELVAEKPLPDSPIKIYGRPQYTDPSLQRLHELGLSL